MFDNKNGNKNNIKWNLNLETEYQTLKNNVFGGLTAASVWFRTNSNFTTTPGLLCLDVSLQTAKLRSGHCLYL